MEQNYTEVRIAETIRSLRQHKGINQEVLAAALAVSTQAVSKWETGASVPDVMMIPRIAGYFGVTTDHIYFGGEMPTEAKETAPGSPFPDDGILRVVQFMGGVMLSAEDAKAGEAVKLSLNEAAALTESTGKQIVIPVEVHGSANIQGTVNGDVKAENDISCDTVNGSAAAGRDLHCRVIGGNAAANGNIEAEQVSGRSFGNVEEEEFERSSMKDRELDAERFEREAERIARRAELREKCGDLDGEDRTPTPVSLFPDDGVLRVVQFMGGVMLSAEEAKAGEAVELSLNEAAALTESTGKQIVLPIEIHGSANFSDIHNGDVNAAGNVTCGTVNGNVQAKGDVSCGTVNGNASAGKDLRSPTINGNANAGGNIMADRVAGGLGDFGRDLGRLGRELGKAFRFGRSHAGPAPDLPFPDDGVLRVVQFIGTRPAVWTDRDDTDPIPLEIELAAEQQKKPVVNVQIFGSAEIVGSVNGSASADGDLTCGDVGMNVSADGDLTCGDVRGNAAADGDVTCGNVGGNLTADGDVTCTQVNGNVTAEGDVSCENVGGNVTTEGDVNCGDVTGSVTSESDVNCGNVGKDVSCEGDLSCGNIQGSVKSCEGSIECGNIGGSIRCEGDVHFR
ncbi:MAG: helix-turn-helix domain-containing protein [Oscillospiraceae bacterium]|nr:helix-turn-helix domain-containing protein [Oscillospiraceae bacterium]